MFDRIYTQMARNEDSYGDLQEIVERHLANAMEEIAELRETERNGELSSELVVHNGFGWDVSFGGDASMQIVVDNIRGLEKRLIEMVDFDEATQLYTVQYSDGEVVEMTSDEYYDAKQREEMGG